MKVVPEYLPSDFVLQDYALRLLAQHRSARSGDPKIDELQRSCVLLNTEGEINGIALEIHLYGALREPRSFKTRRDLIGRFANTMMKALQQSCILSNAGRLMASGAKPSGEPCFNLRCVISTSEIGW